MSRFAGDDKEEPKVMKNCAKCHCDLYEGQMVVRDMRHGDYFCGDECLRNYLLEFIDDEIYELVSLLRANHDVVSKILGE